MTANTLDALLKWGIEELNKQEVLNASLDAWYLMEYAFGISRVDFLLKRDDKLDHDSEAKILQYEALILRRKKGCPVQYLMGYTEFMGLTFEVNEHVLIPRQDTEVLVETALDFMKPEYRVLDMCTGSGCIILSLAVHGHLESGTGSDISPDALAVAGSNRDRHQLFQIDLIQGDLFENISGRYDMIVSNPPYIPSGEIDKLMREVKDHEPRLALDGSVDGLMFYRRIAEQAGDYLVPGGMLMMEIGCDQADDITVLLNRAGFKDIHVKKDLAGLDRVIYAVK
ncbi:MAG: peptide chain release factor N(5)-glutamine methyltransferase [Coprococcus sp.]